MNIVKGHQKADENDAFKISPLANILLVRITREDGYILWLRLRLFERVWA